MPKIYHDNSGSWYGDDVYLTVKQQKFNGKCVIEYLLSLGWSNNSVAAILGNISFESTVNPMLSERSGSGYGLTQWTPKSKLINRAKSIKMGSTYNTMATQLAVINYEATTNKQWIQTNDYPISFEEFTRDNTHDVLWLTGAWLKNYERPYDQSQANIQLRYDGDNGHVGSNEWSSIIGGGGSGSIDGFINWLLNIASDNSYTYELGANHTDPPEWDRYLTVKKFDCSSFLSFGLYHGGGYDIPDIFTTAGEREKLVDFGFDAVDFKDKSQLKKGDILLKDGHTEAVSDVNGNDVTLVGAHRHYPNNPDRDISTTPFYEEAPHWHTIIRPYDSGGGNTDTPKFKRRKLDFVYPKRRF